MFSQKEFNEAFKLIVDLKNVLVSENTRDAIYQKLITDKYDFSIKDLIYLSEHLSDSDKKIEWNSVINYLQESKLKQKEKTFINEINNHKSLIPSHELSRDCINLINKKITGQININEYIEDMIHLGNKYSEPKFIQEAGALKQIFENKG